MGRVISTALPNGVTTTKKYDEKNFLSYIESYSWRRGVVSSFLYTYDNMGNKLSVTEEDGKKTTFQYDPTYQITRVDHPKRFGVTVEPSGEKEEGKDKEEETYGFNGSEKSWSWHQSNSWHSNKWHSKKKSLTFESFTYDPASNRLTYSNDAESIDYQYNMANQMLLAGSSQFEYDANGNRVSKTEGKKSIQYSYTYDDMLAQVDKPSNKNYPFSGNYHLKHKQKRYDTTQYGYDALNRRVYKVDHHNNLTSYLYDGTEVLQEISGRRLQDITAYYRANGELLIKQEYTAPHWYSSYQYRPKGRQLFYTYDALGSVASLTHGYGGVESRYRYTAYGNLAQGTMHNNEYGFTGKRFDQETGTYHFHFRQYDATTGVWMTPDPIGVFGGLNLYRYVGNNPVKWVDWLGLWGTDADEDNDSTGFGSGLENEYDQDDDGYDDNSPCDIDEGNGSDKNWLKQRRKKRILKSQAKFDKIDKEFELYERGKALGRKLSNGSMTLSGGELVGLSEELAAILWDPDVYAERKKQYEREGCK